LPERIAISIVDDDVSFREALVDLMKSYGFSVEAFDSGASFLKSLRRLQTDCLLADVQMPGMTGLELHSCLIASGNPVPTILITAYQDETVRERALKSGILCYLTKPFDEDRLLACIRSALGSRDFGNTPRM
jgi:FixJ family two-component response regulator